MKTYEISLKLVRDDSSDIIKPELSITPYKFGKVFSEEELKSKFGSPYEGQHAFYNMDQLFFSLGIEKISCGKDSYLFVYNKQAYIFNANLQLRNLERGRYNTDNLINYDLDVEVYSLFLEHSGLIHNKDYIEIGHFKGKTRVHFNDFFISLGGYNELKHSPHYYIKKRDLFNFRNKLHSFYMPDDNSKEVVLENEVNLIIEALDAGASHEIKYSDAKSEELLREILKFLSDLTPSLENKEIAVKYIRAGLSLILFNRLSLPYISDTGIIDYFKEGQDEKSWNEEIFKNNSTISLYNVIFKYSYEILKHNYVSYSTEISLCKFFNFDFSEEYHTTRKVILEALSNNFYYEMLDNSQMFDLFNKNNKQVNKLIYKVLV